MGLTITVASYTNASGVGDDCSFREPWKPRIQNHLGDIVDLECREIEVGFTHVVKNTLVVMPVV